ncbi:MAG: glycosyltransferase family 4 protein [Chloroflexi bacterium]|nr:glycosyltransferase family 4 protein [Chloroflexota bacterium]
MTHVLMFGVGSQPPTFIRRQIDTLRAAGLQVSTWEYRTPLQGLLRKVAIHGRVSFGSILDLPPTKRALLREADLYHFQWPQGLFEFGPVARRLGIPTIVSLRGMAINIQPHTPGNEAYVRNLRRVLPTCSAYHGVSQAILQEAEKFGLVMARARVIYTALDLSFFAPAPTPPPPEPLQIIMIGRLEWVKGYEYAVRVLEQVVNRHQIDARLVIIGDGEDEERVRFTAADLGVGDRVVLAGKLPPDGVRDMIHRSHLLLHTALSEGIANAVVEGMACGLPVVTTRAGGMDEAVGDGIEGFVVPSRDVPALAEAVARLAHDPDLRQKMGSAGRARALRQFAPDRQGAEFVDLYRAALHTAGKS